MSSSTFVNENWNFFKKSTSSVRKYLKSTVKLKLWIPKKGKRSFLTT